MSYCIDLSKASNALGKKVLLLSIPVGLMTLAVKLIGKGELANRLFDSLQMDRSKVRGLLDWKPLL